MLISVPVHIRSCILHPCDTVRFRLVLPTLVESRLLHSDGFYQFSVWWILQLSNHSMAIENLNLKQRLHDKYYRGIKVHKYLLSIKIPLSRPQYIKLKSFIFIQIGSSHSVYCSESIGWKTGKIHHCVDSCCATMNA